MRHKQHTILHSYFYNLYGEVEVEVGVGVTRHNSCKQTNVYAIDRRNEGDRQAYVYTVQDKKNESDILPAHFTSHIIANIIMQTLE